MAHYAFLNQNNVVTEIITGIDESELIEGLDPETWYANFKIIMTVPMFDNQGNLQGIEDTIVAVFNKLAASSIVFNVTAVTAPK